MIRFLRHNGRGIILIVATYFYFLIFAQFAFVELLNADLKKALNPMMAAMALSGIIGSLITPLILKRLGASRTLTLALIGCACMSGLAIPAHTFPSYLAVSIGTGLSLGLLTSCASRFESVSNYVVYKGATNSYYNQDDTVLRDRETGDLWRVNREYPAECLWERIGNVSMNCPPTSGSK